MVPCNSSVIQLGLTPEQDEGCAWPSELFWSSTRGCYTPLVAWEDEVRAGYDLD